MKVSCLDAQRFGNEGLDFLGEPLFLGPIVMTISSKAGWAQRSLDPGLTSSLLPPRHTAPLPQPECLHTPKVICSAFPYTCSVIWRSSMFFFITIITPLNLWIPHRSYSGIVCNHEKLITTAINILANVSQCLWMVVGCLPRSKIARGKVKIFCI